MLFQFHKGTIKTLDGNMSDRQSINFNSIKVQLKPVREILKEHLTPFQFHKGTIKTY